MHHFKTCRRLGVDALLLSLAVLAAELSSAAEATIRSPYELKNLSLDELFNVEVTSVSRGESTVGQSPAAVFVITPEVIHGSGATTFPELFRMVPGMDVARIDGNKWAVSARGFNDRFGGKISDKLYYRVYGKGFTREEQFSRSGDPNDGWWGASAGLRLDWQVSERDTFTFQGDFLSSEAGRKDLRPMVAAPFVLTNVETEVTHAGNVVSRWSHQLENGSSWT